MSRIEKYVETESKISGCLRPVGRGGGEKSRDRSEVRVVSEAYGVSFLSDENTLKLRGVIVVHICEYAKDY